MTSGTPYRDRAGVHSIDHFALEVPELNAAQAFFDAFGLRVTTGSAGLDLYASGSDHRWGRILPGKRKRLAYLAFNCYVGDFESIGEQVKAAGAAAADPHPAGSAQGLWCRDPDGNLLQIQPGPKTSPDAKPPSVTLQAGAGARAILGRSGYERVRPRRMSHVLLFSNDVP